MASSNAAPLSMFAAPPAALTAAAAASGWSSFYICVTASNRVRVSVPSSGALIGEFSSDQHLAQGNTVTAIACAYALNDGADGDAADGSASSALLQAYVFLGTADGSLLCVSVRSFECVARLQTLHTAPITGLAARDDALRLYTCSEDRTCKELLFSPAAAAAQAAPASILHAAAGAASFLPPSDYPYRALALAPDASMLAVAAGSSVRVYDLSVSVSGGAAPALLHKHVGHQTAVHLLAFSADAQLLLTGAQNDRFIALWDAKRPAAAKKDGAKKGKAAAAASAFANTPLMTATLPSAPLAAGFSKVSTHTHTTRAPACMLSMRCAIV